ncbi:hypothetical protein [Vagococcus silagei]|uniref:Uncharacterized protein n=1 Tax=Vagococcus silagei TaxID=2508885 RepID=A0A4V3TV59_9ENTE|nr:hypothetical protein [Vagococcus silagei]THB61609.1 hypothetical protein ESZ54_03920 [Vagococcus silagei]
MTIKNSSLIKYEQFRASTFANGFIYFLGRIPFLGKYVPTGMLYGDYALKKIISYFRWVFQFLWLFLKGSVALILSFFVSTLFDHFDYSFIFSWAIISFIFFAPLNTMYPLLSDQDLKFLQYFHQSKKEYVRNKLLLNQIMRLISIIPSLIIMGLFTKAVLLSLVVGISGFLFFNCLWLLIAQRLSVSRLPRLVKNSLLWIYLVVAFFAVLILSDEPPMDMFHYLIFNPVGIVVCLIGAFVFGYLFLNYRRFDDYVLASIASVETLSKWSSDVNKNSKDKYLSQGRSFSKKMTLGNTEKLKNVSGSAYLNGLFFIRFSDVLKKGLLYRVAGISIFGLAICLLNIFVPQINSVVTETRMYKILPPLFFIMYLLSFGKPVVQSLFINCDSSMLNYPFYREPKAIVRGFMYRFKQLLAYNSVILLTVLFWFGAFNAVNGFLLSRYFFLVLTVLLLSLSVLFSFHELFIYYLLQPFTSDMKVVNPVYKVVDGVFYFIAYMNIQIKHADLRYALFVSACSILYFIIGMLVISKIAPKTFKLKS